MALHKESGKFRQLNARNARIVRILAACLCVCLAFCLGFFIRGDAAILKRVGLTSLVVDVDKNPGMTVQGNTYASLSARAAEVEGILANDSLNTYDLTEATNLVLTAFAASTQDPYLRYYDEARYSDYVQERAGKYGGIGVLFSEDEGGTYAADVLEGSAAEAAGVNQGDVVVAIDGDRSQAWSAPEVINAIAAHEGESVVITWRHVTDGTEDAGKDYTTTLQSFAYTVANVKGELVDKVGYISLRQLTQNSSDLVKKEIESLTSQGAASFVLDVRDNPGGYLTQAVDIASLFVESGEIVQIETREGTTTKKSSAATLTGLPLIVLVNHETASATEVLAAALQSSGRATVVGLTTKGKGSVQVVKELSFGGALRYTAAYYKTPLGHDINEVGVTPNISVGKDSGSEADEQKDFALDTARSLAPA